MPLIDGLNKVLVANKFTVQSAHNTITMKEKEQVVYINGLPPGAVLVKFPEGQVGFLSLRM